RPLCCQVTAILHPPCHRVPLDEVRAEHLGEPSLNRPAPEIHLEQAILRLHKSLREEEIVLIRRVDMRHSPAVADDAYWGGEARDGDGARDLWRLRRRCRRLPATRDPTARSQHCSNRVLPESRRPPSACVHLCSPSLR